MHCSIRPRTTLRSEPPFRLGEACPSVGCRRLQGCCRPWSRHRWLAPTATGTAASVSAALKRPVQPIVTTLACAWGTRLDDRSTMLVLIQMSASHAAYDTQLETS